MTRTGWAWAFGGAAALICGLGAVPAAEAAGCQLVKVADLPVALKGDQIRVQVSINGQPGWFLIDTGSSTIVMFGGAARGYGLRVSTEAGAVLYGVGGGQEVMSAIVSEFALGEVKARNFRFFVVGNKGTRDEAGTFGRDVLGHYDLEFDLANNRVRLFQPNGCAGQSLAYWTRTPEITDLRHDNATAPYEVKLLVDGKPVDAMLDSGASASFVTPEVAAIGPPADDASGPSRPVRGIGENTVESHVAAFDSVQIGDELIRNVRLRVSDLFVDDKARETGSRISHQVTGLPTMLLGADFLRSHRVLIAASQHLLYFTYSGGQVFQGPGAAAAAADKTAPTP